MKRMFVFAALVTLCPLVAAAQVAPPPPPKPVSPPAPPAPPIASPHVTAWPNINWPDIDISVQDAMQAAREAVARVDVDQISRTAMEAARTAMEHARLAMPEHFDINLGDFQEKMKDVEWKLKDMQDRNFTISMGGDAYSSGLVAIGSRDYARAITRFDQVIAQKGTHVDGALYWKAFAQYKLGKPDEALTTIAELRKSYGQSRYLNDAKMLETDAKRLSGQSVKPETLNDDELKLLAIQGLIHTDPVAAIPALEGVLNGTNSLRVKRNALYVLALSDQPRAHEILLSYAKGAAGNPDLQRVAIGYIATRDRKQTTDKELSDIYNSTQDIDVRRAIIDAYASSGNKAGLMTIASSTSGPIEIRRQAINGLASVPAPQELWQLYQKEENKELRIQMVSAFGADQLMQALKTEKDPDVRRRIIRSLGNRKVDVAGPALIDLYNTEQDRDVKRSIISALANQENAEGLVAIAKKESAIELKTEIVRRIADLAPKSKVAADYLRDVIK